MAKGQKRGNREIKKPKTVKKPIPSNTALRDQIPDLRRDASAEDWRKVNPQTRATKSAYSGTSPRTSVPGCTT